MEQHVIGIIFLVVFIYVAVMEEMDRKNVPDIPECSRITNYCTVYGEKQNVKYVIKEPIREETVDALLNKIETDCHKVSNLVYWRVSFLVALITCIFIWLFNRVDRGTEIKWSSYLFILVSAWLLNYWSRNYLDFHYHNHMCVSIKESVEKLKDLLKV